MLLYWIEIMFQLENQQDKISCFSQLLGKPER